MFTLLDSSTILPYDDADAECARRLLAAIIANTPQAHQEDRIKAMQGYAMASEELEGSEA